MTSTVRSGPETGAAEVGPTAASTKVTASTKKRSEPAAAAKEAVKVSKPFSMSYGGGTTAEYLQYRIDRGAR